MKLLPLIICILCSANLYCAERKPKDIPLDLRRFAMDNAAKKAANEPENVTQNNQQGDTGQSHNPRRRTSNLEARAARLLELANRAYQPLPD